MKIAQLCKRTYNNQLPQSIYLCHRINMSQICPYQVSTSYTLQFQRYNQDKILKVKVTMAVKCQIKVILFCCTPTSPNQCPYQATIYYTLQFPKYRLDKISKTQGHCNKVKSRSHYNATHLHHLINVPNKNHNFLHLTVSEIQPRQTFPQACLPECSSGHHG